MHLIFFVVNLGICIGASSVSLVVLENGKIKNWNQLHEGNPKGVLSSLLGAIDLKKIDNAIVTGRKFKEFVNLENVSEPEAIENALKFLKIKDYDTIISAGGENFIVYALDSESKLSKVYTGNKCASGTGEFFLQQITRMGLSVEEAIKLGLDGKAHKISGRCSVFCKSDCTHALNNGEKKANIVAGLCQMMADKIIELLSKSKYQKVMLIGGTSKNSVMLKYLRDLIPDIFVPEEATYFEALGAAYLAESKKPEKKIDINDLFIKEKSSFSFHKPLSGFVGDVDFKTTQKGVVEKNDVCLIGLDVGSTTTKAIILRKSDDKILADVYLRTNGDPVGASVNCYKALKEQIDVPIEIIGLGVTGSGRYISGLHALTKGIINEIIAHATAAAFFDKEVDTIFEIGGQDAKYTYLTNGVASDYAMNEACSAGTGSFIEESAKESLGIDYKEIGDIAMGANNPPNFNDQCAAFISSDIKNASHEGLKREDIVAGLVYSICMNYANRVKGNRPVGKKIFMQGGVCYNKAVPIAMAALLGKKIIVPPEPGLMGAYGVALEIKKRLSLGLIKEQKFDLAELAERKVIYHNSFKCFGDASGCDRKCEINMIEVAGKKYPFGGACNRYYNLQLDIKGGLEDLDYISLRQKLVYEKYVTLKNKEAKKTIGITKSFVTNTYYPLYYNFFTKLGFEVVLSDEVDKEGENKIASAFCYPVEIAHGLFYNLVKKNVDYIFLPHILEIEVKNESEYKKSCVFVQAESYYLRSAFKDVKLPKILSPIISFGDGVEKAEKYFIKTAKILGFDDKKAKQAFGFAAGKQREMFDEFKKIGREVIERVEKENKYAVVVFGRPYNAFAKEANMGIPRKFSSRGKIVIPYDFLPIDTEKNEHYMYWGLGNMILKAAKYVKRHPLLFATYVTNFSCGPDAFLLTYFRDIMGIKPSLTLELDSHSADAGINTRIEAALDIIDSYMQLKSKGMINEKVDKFIPAKVIHKNNKPFVKVGKEKISLKDKRVKVILSSMGQLGTVFLAATFRSMGIRCEAMPIPDMETLKLGRAHTTCKECLPLILTTGTMLQYIKKREADEITLFFMPKSSGPCRLGQYRIFQAELIRKQKIENVAVFSLDDEKSYDEFGKKFLLIAWIAIIASDFLGDIRSIISVLAKNREKALEIFDEEIKKFVKIIETGKILKILSYFRKMADKFSKNIELKYSLEDAKIISLVGEIYVRREEFSRLDLIPILEKKGFVVLPTPVSEYIYYCNYLTKNVKHGTRNSLKNKVNIYLVDFVERFLEKRIKKDLTKSGLINYEMVDIDKTIDHSKHLISENMMGESILTVGSALREILTKACGVVSIGPFACMPSRVAEAILNKEMNMQGKEKAGDDNFCQDLNINELPFIAIETDGNAFPQIIQSRLEIFMLQAERLHKKMQDNKHKIKK